MRGMELREKILFVINTLGRAGAETAMCGMMDFFPAEKYEVYCYVILGQGELVEELPKHVILLNRSYHKLSVLSGQGRLQMGKTVVKSFFRNGELLKKIKQMGQNYLEMKKGRRIMLDKLLWRVLSDGAERYPQEFDLAIAYIEGAAAYYVADHVNAKKKAAFVHISYARAGYTPGMDRGCYREFDRIFAVSDEARAGFLEVYPQYADKTRVFHNRIDRSRVLARAKEMGGFSDAFHGIRILTVGRLTYQKGYDIAIRAMKLLKEEGVAVRWYVLGEGDQRASLERQIQELALAEDFLLCGAAANPYPYMRQCDLYVHATRFEGKSIAIQEAQILGCPIIASDCSGNREQLIDGEEGFLCRLEPEDIRDKILVLIKDARLREKFSKASSEKKMNFDREQELLQELMMEGRRE